MKCVHTTLITHGNSPPVLETSKHDFNLVPSFIKVLVIKNRLLPVLSGWNARCHSLVEECLAKPGGIITTIRQKVLSLWQGVQKHSCSPVITCLTFREDKSRRLSISIAKGMEFCVQSSFCTSNASRKIPFLSKLAAVR